MGRMGPMFDPTDAWGAVEVVEIVTAKMRRTTELAIADISFP
jgi:hypothetical protein